MNDKHFIMTQDEDAAKILMEHGYKLFSITNNTYIFENSPAKSFSDMGSLKLIYTNTFFA